MLYSPVHFDIKLHYIKKFACVRHISSVHSELGPTPIHSHVYSIAYFNKQSYIHKKKTKKNV